MDNMSKSEIGCALIERIKTLWLYDLECGMNYEMYIRVYNRFVMKQRGGKGIISTKKLNDDEIKSILRTNMGDVIKLMLTWPHQYEFYDYVTLIGNRIYYGDI